MLSERLRAIEGVFAYFLHIVAPHEFHLDEVVF